MALRNGLLVHGPTHWAAAVRTEAGRRQGRVRPQAARARASTTCPACAALVRLGEAFAVIPLVKRGLPQAQAAVRERRACSASPRARRSPARCCSRRVPGIGGESRRPLIASLAPALFALRGGELAAYHGVEHKAIAAYEADDEDARDALEGARALRLAPDRADAGRQPRGHAAARAGARAARAPLAGGAVGARVAPPRRSRSSPGASATPTRRSPQRCNRPGFELQRLIGTREPDERQLEVGRAALAEILRVEAARTRVQTPLCRA